MVIEAEDCKLWGIQIGAVLGRGLGFWSEKENFKFGYHIGLDEFDSIEYIESLGIWVVM